MFAELGVWTSVADGHPEAAAIYRRHYSARRYADGRLADPRNRNRHLIVGPGEKLVLLGLHGSDLFVCRKFIDDSGQTGVNIAAFRKESPRRAPLASEMIREGCEIAWHKWPGERLYTFVDPTKVRSPNPGCCFIKAGFRRCGMTKSGLLIFERLAELEWPME